MTTFYFSNDQCGGCYAVFHDGTGKLLTMDDCILTTVKMTTKTTPLTTVKMTTKTTPQTTVEMTTETTPLTSVEIKTETTPLTTVEMIKTTPAICPPDKQYTHCFVEPCDETHCAAIKGAVCT